KSLLVVSVIGMVAAAAAVVWAVLTRDVWFVVLAGFAAMRCWAGFQQARIMAKLLKFPNHEDAACPSCGTPPLAGDFWMCDQCQAQFDPFTPHAICPRCGNTFPATACVFCGHSHPVAAWFEAARERGFR